MVFEAAHGTTFMLDGSPVVDLLTEGGAEVSVPMADLLEFAAEQVRAQRLAQLSNSEASGSERWRLMEEARLRGAEPHTLLGIDRLPNRDGSRVEDDPHESVDLIARALVEAWAEAPFESIIPPVIPEWAERHAFDILARLRSTPSVRQLYAFEVVDGMVWTVYFAHSFSDAHRHHELYLAAGDMMSDAGLYTRLLSGDTEFTVPNEDGESRTMPVSAWMEERNTPGVFLSGMVEPEDLEQD